MSSSKVIIRFLNIAVILLCAPIFWMAFNEGGKWIGLTKVPVEVVGTGSMYPSLFWDQSEGGPENFTLAPIAEFRTTPLMYRRFTGITFLGQTYFRRPLAYGDLVTFASATTRNILAQEGKNPQSGFIKRIIGVPGDTIELRDGYVLKNGTPLPEPYINTPRSTYGGSTLPDCRPLQVGPGQYFVLGDNRKVSSDSRFELGLVSDQDISFILPYSEQSSYQSLWRDPSRDQELVGTPTLNTNEFYRYLTNLRPTPKLSQSSARRAQALLTNPKTTYSMEQAILDVGYSNVILGEFITYGHYSAEELYQNLLSQSNTAQQLKNSDYDDIGLAIKTGEVNGCPTQIIVGHLGGYLPATYEASVVESWQKSKDSLISVLASWEKGVEYNQLDQSKLTELLVLLRRRLALAEEVLSVMSRREWLSDTQKAKISADQQDAERINQLANELNQE